MPRTTLAGLAIWFRNTRGGKESKQIAGNCAWAATFLLVTLSMQLLCPLQTAPGSWHIPAFLMPWAPAITIALIMFGLTGFGATDWLKIGIYNAAALLLYFIYALPMTYIRNYTLDFDNVEQLK